MYERRWRNNVQFSSMVGGRWEGKEPTQAPAILGGSKNLDYSYSLQGSLKTQNLLPLSLDEAQTRYSLRSCNNAFCFRGSLVDALQMWQGPFLKCTLARNSWTQCTRYSNMHQLLKNKENSGSVNQECKNSCVRSQKIAWHAGEKTSHWNTWVRCPGVRFRSQAPCTMYSQASQSLETLAPVLFFFFFFPPPSRTMH